ncbi:DUF1631 family protein [Rugamonas sp. CCM 8940]|uniref:DUF1631 family protein n=1 Tax=Rugamonas sp. CCM 8940 TaxID=2765359 RepID=UPI0018F60994|nr:DUF1631 family protein [Rugamonas sp. CCM 8940]MBJ7310629.1 DUF1631 family protein [Rugamonas sp. CCM 8940]
MISSPPSIAPSTPSKPVSPRHALLEELIGIATSHLNAQLPELATRLAGALIDARDGEPGTLQQRIRAGNLLRNRNYAFLHLAHGALERALRQDLAQLAPAPSARAQQGAQPLGLVPYEEMDNRVALGTLCKPFELLHADALQTLSVRLAFLFERDILRGGQNPFRPEVLMRALHASWAEFAPDADLNQLLTPLCKPGLFFELAPMLDALNLALQRKGVLPGAANGSRERKTDAPARPAARPRANPAALAQQLRQFFSAGADDDALAEAFDMSIPDLPNLPPGGGRPWRQGAAEGFHPGQDNHVAQRQTLAGAKRPLLSYLAQLQRAMPLPAAAGFVAGAGGAGCADRADGADGADGAAAGAAGTGASAGAAGSERKAGSAKVFYLPGIKDSLPRGSLSRADESTIDLLAAIFETVFGDQNIAQEIRDLIHLLQIPVLKAALVDRDFFFQEEHPARRLIELLSRLGWERRRGPDDPLFQAMRRSVDRVGRDDADERAVFAAAVDELEASVRAEESAAASALAVPVAAALKQEKLAQAGQQAKGAVALRLGSGEVVAVLEAFLENKWVDVLTIAYSVEDDKPGAVRNATLAMDQLIWSVKPKLGADERKRLIGLLPDLLATLNKWLDIIHWRDAERLQFFAELAECHASIVRAPLDISAERQLELAMQAARQSAERRAARQAEQESAQAAAQAATWSASSGASPSSESAESSASSASSGAPLGAAADTAAADAEAALAAEASAEVAALARGMWLAFEQPDGTRRKVKLAWISPLRTLYIFATATRQEAFSMAGAALEERFRAHGVQVQRADGVVGLALSRALAGVAGNDAGADADADAEPAAARRSA